MVLDLMSSQVQPCYLNLPICFIPLFILVPIAHTLTQFPFSPTIHPFLLIQAGKTNGQAVPCLMTKGDRIMLVVSTLQAKTGHAAALL